MFLISFFKHRLHHHCHHHHHGYHCRHRHHYYHGNLDERTHWKASNCRVQQFDQLITCSMQLVANLVKPFIKKYKHQIQIQIQTQIINLLNAASGPPGQTLHYQHHHRHHRQRKTSLLKDVLINLNNLMKRMAWLQLWCQRISKERQPTSILLLIESTISKGRKTQYYKYRSHSTCTTTHTKNYTTEKCIALRHCGNQDQICVENWWK